MKYVRLHVKAGGIPRSFLTYISARRATIIDLYVDCDEQIRLDEVPEDSEDRLEVLGQFLAQGTCKFRHIAATEGIFNDEIAETYARSVLSRDTKSELVSSPGSRQHGLLSCTSLDFSDTSFWHVSLDIWETLILRNKKLTALCLSACHLDEPKVLFLSKSLERNTSLTELDIQVVRVPNQALTRFIVTNRTLKKLCVEQRRGQDLGAVMMALKDNDALDHVNFEGSSRGFGFHDLAACLTTNRNIVFMNLRGTSFPCREQIRGSPADLGLALQINSTLTHLDLSWSGLTSECAIVLGAALQVNSSLKFLGLARNLIEDTGFRAIAEGMSHNYSLQYLLIGKNKVTPREPSTLGASFRMILSASWI